MALESRKIRHPITKIVVSKVNQFFTDTYSRNDTTSKSALDNIRQTLYQDSQKRKKSSKVIFSDMKIEGIPVEMTSPKTKKSDNIILYIHGGAFMIGLVSYSRHYAEMLAVQSGCTVYSVDYSLSPENKYPTALDECEKVYRKLRKDYPDSKIAFTGDSAGGGLCISLALRLKAKNFALPSSIVVHSPVADISGQLDRSINTNHDSIIRYSRFHRVKDIYAGNADTFHYEISPIYGDFTGFPPTFITCDEHETMLADSIELDGLIEKAGGTVRTVKMDGAFHAFAVMGTIVPETKALMQEYIAFIRQYF